MHRRKRQSVQPPEGPHLNGLSRPDELLLWLRQLLRAHEIEILIEDELLVPAIAQNQPPVGALPFDRHDGVEAALANRVQRYTAKIACDHFRKIYGFVVPVKGPLAPEVLLDFVD